MEDETFRACQLEIRKRIKHIDWFHSSNAPQSDRAGLVSIGRALGVLARRFIKEPEWPGHDVTDDVRLSWELAWYFDYLKAIAEVSRAAQIAVREKRLILRSQLTRTALDKKSLDAWINMDLDAAQADAMKGFFPGILELNTTRKAWPDALYPPGAAYAQDIAAWTAADGIATADDALALLMGTADTTTPAPVMPAGASNGTPDPERRLARLRALGGTVKCVRHGWKFTGITALVQSEKQEGRKRSDEQTIRADLKEAAQIEQEAKSAGFQTGLGQR